MAIKDTTDYNALNREILEEVERIEGAIIYNLKYVATQAVNIARDTTLQGTYKDQTVNLRSSIGAMILRDGVPIWGAEPYEEATEKGQQAGEALLQKLAREFPRGIVLVLVAGMNYAHYVSRRGYDVLDSAELEAERLLPLLLSKIKGLIIKRK